MPYSRRTSKTKLIVEIVVFLALSIAIPRLVAWLLPFDGLWMGVLSYALNALVILLYVAVIDHRPLVTIGLRRAGQGAASGGVLLGVVMFGAQLVPFLFMGADFRMFAAVPSWRHILVMSLYCLFCVGVVEELVFRGFLLHKSLALFRSRFLAVVLNCLLFWVYHWPPLPFSPGQFFNLALNTVILCLYLYLSKDKSIFALMIGHGVYDVLMVYLFPAAMYYLYR